jgi:hypothetical protein
MVGEGAGGDTKSFDVLRRGARRSKKWLLGCKAKPHIQYNAIPCFREEEERERERERDDLY